MSRWTRSTTRPRQRTADPAEWDVKTDTLSGGAIVDRAVITIITGVDAVTWTGYAIAPGNQNSTEVVSIDHAIEIEVSTDHQFTFHWSHFSKHQSKIASIDSPVSIQVTFAGVGALLGPHGEVRSIGLNRASHPPNLVRRELPHADLPRVVHEIFDGIHGSACIGAGTFEVR